MDEVAVERHVVVVADDHHLRAGIADIGQQLELGEEVEWRELRFEDHQIGRRCRLKVLARRLDPPHLDLQMGLGHAPVRADPFDRLGDRLGLAEGLDGDPRDRADLVDLLAILRLERAGFGCESAFHRHGSDHQS